MDTSTRRLADRLTTVFNASEAAGGQSWLWGPLLKLLATGRPVTTDRLAQATDRGAEEIRQALTAMPDVEYDEDGRIVGNGLTQRPTPHHFEVDGVQLFTWCALDTLIFPAALGRTARVQSPCHATGTPIRLTVTPDGVTALEPATAVVSIVTPEEMPSVRASFCDHVHYFAHPEAARAGSPNTPA